MHCNVYFWCEFPVHLALGYWHSTLLVISQHKFKLWLGAIRQQAITWANVDADLCYHMSSQGPNGWTSWEFPGNLCVSWDSLDNMWGMILLTPWIRPNLKTTWLRSLLLYCMLEEQRVNCHTRPTNMTGLFSHSILQSSPVPLECSPIYSRDPL